MLRAPRQVATGGQTHEALPMLLMVPRFLCGAGAGGYTFLGFGDVVLPGLLLVYACIHDLAFPPARGCACGYFLPASLGYGAGLALTYGALLLELGGDQVRSPVSIGRL